MKVDDLRNINNDKIKVLKEQIAVSSNDEVLQKDFKKHAIISNILEDDACFFKMPVDVALNLLKELIAEEELKEVYSALINPDSYKELNDLFKI